MLDAETAADSSKLQAALSEKENKDVNEPDSAEAEPSARASWAGKLSKWASALKPTGASAPAAAEPKEEASQVQPTGSCAAAAADSLSADAQQGEDVKAAGGSTLSPLSTLGRLTFMHSPARMPGCADGLTTRRRASTVHMIAASAIGMLYEQLVLHAC